MVLLEEIPNIMFKPKSCILYKFLFMGLVPCSKNIISVSCIIFPVSLSGVWQAQVIGSTHPSVVTANDMTKFDANMRICIYESGTFHQARSHSRCWTAALILSLNLSRVRIHLRWWSSWKPSPLTASRSTATLRRLCFIRTKHKMKKQ